LDTNTLRHILAMAERFKVDDSRVQPLAGKTLAMIFEKPSTRTRVSFEVGMCQLGGNVVVMSPQETHLGRGETVADTARVLSRYVDAIMIRTDNPAKAHELAQHATVPVINGLTDRSHPCQLMADVMTYEEHRGPIRERRVAWVGDGNNVAATWVQAAARFGFEIHVACPTVLQPDATMVDWARQQGGKVILTEDPVAAVTGADCVATDTWVSMGDEAKGSVSERHNLLLPYRVTNDLLRHAADDAVFMHCLPAHRGEEVTSEVLDGPQSVVWDEAENRLHAQKGILAWCLDDAYATA
jgi:ornithine carbamoyltransferase